MPLPFDATLKDLAQVSPRGLLAVFDRLPTLPVSLLNIVLSTVTTVADLVFGLGNPVQEIVHLDFQSSASATKHADILVYNALLHRQYLVPVHSIVILLRPQAAHANLNGTVAYAPGRNGVRWIIAMSWYGCGSVQRLNFWRAKLGCCRWPSWGVCRRVSNW